jgi:hypothetical protein
MRIADVSVAIAGAHDTCAFIAARYTATEAMQTGLANNPTMTRADETAGECACRASEVGTSGRAGGDHRVRTRLRREVPEGRREDRRRRRRAAGVVPLPGGALDPSAHDEPHRIYFRNSAFEGKVTKGPGSRAAGLAMAFKLIRAAEARWRAVNAPHLVALVRAGAVFEKGKLIE